MNESSKHRGGTGAALFSIIIWSSTYISTTILVQSFTPLQISFVRFSIGLGVMLVLAPPRKAPLRLSGEIPFMGAGFLGMFLYYFLENMAARHTYAANVSVIVTSIPLLTSLMAPLFFKEETLRPRSLVSFLLTMGGFLLILSQSETKGGLSPLGDLLALAAAVVFALYTLLLRTIDPQLSTLLVTRKTLQYGWIAITAATLLSRSLPNPAQILQGYNPAHFLFLGIAASGLSFITWTHAVSTLGPVRSSQFIYLVPLITVTLSTLILKEQFTPLHMAGLLLILGAVIFSQLNFPLPAKSNPN